MWLIALALTDEQKAEIEAAIQAKCDPKPSIGLYCAAKFEGDRLESRTIAESFMRMGHAIAAGLSKEANK